MNNFLFQDWSSNRGNLRSQIVLLLFRIAQWFHHLPLGLRWIGFPYFSFYELLVVWILGIELNYKATIGPGLRLFHGVAIVIHESVVMGKNCTLRHSTTIGMKHEREAVPTLGDGVDIGCQSVIIGPIRIGDGVVIGAGSVVLHDLPDYAVAAGSPARVLKMDSQKKRINHKERKEQKD